MNEIRDMVGQREVVVESISTNIVRDMQHLLAELRLSRKKVLSLNNIFIMIKIIILV